MTDRDEAPTDSAPSGLGALDGKRAQLRQAAWAIVALFLLMAAMSYVGESRIDGRWTVVVNPVNLVGIPVTIACAYALGVVSVRALQRREKQPEGDDPGPGPGRAMRAVALVLPGIAFVGIQALAGTNETAAELAAIAAVYFLAFIAGLALGVASRLDS
jgi:hypothetical protein